MRSDFHTKRDGARRRPRWSSCQLCLDGINRGTSVPAVAEIAGVRVCATHLARLAAIAADAEGTQRARRRHPEIRTGQLT